MGVHHKKRRFSLRARLRSIGFALEGMKTLMLTQHNAWVHCAAILIVCGLGFWAGMSRAEWALLVLAMMAVLSAEALNTAMEFLADAVVPEEHPEIKKAKDVAAGGVLIAAVAALIIGFLVLLPRVVERAILGP